MQQLYERRCTSDFETINNGSELAINSALAFSFVVIKFVASEHIHHHRCRDLLAARRRRRLYVLLR